MKTPERWSDLIKGTLRVHSLGHRNWGPRSNPYSTMPQTVLTELHCSSTSSLTALTSDSSWNWTLASRALMVDTTPLATTELGPCLRNATCTSCLSLLCLPVWCKKGFCKGKWQVTVCGKSLEERELRQSHSEGSNNSHSMCVCESGVLIWDRQWSRCCIQYACLKPQT